MKKYVLFTLSCLLIAVLFICNTGYAKKENEEDKIKSLKIGKKTFTVGVGEKLTLPVKVKPKKLIKNVRFYSCNKKRVTVTKNGVIKGVKKGNTHLYIKSVDGTKKKLKIKIKVVQRAKKIYFLNDVNNISYMPNQQFALYTEIKPGNTNNKTVKFKSSSPKVASISDEGIVTTKAKGTTTITAETQDGSNLKISCKVKVVIPVTSVTLDGGNELFILKRGEKKRISSVVLPADASDTSLSWSSSNTEIATVSSSGMVSGNTNGETTIIARSKDNSMVEARIVVKVVSINLTDSKFIAHRGESAKAPENTKQAFELAVEDNFYAVECDIWKTKDGEFAISHDRSLQRMTGLDKNITDMTLEEILATTITGGNGIEDYPNAHVASLQEFLDVFNDPANIQKTRNMHLFIEIKDESLEEGQESTYFLEEEDIEYLMEMLGSLKKRTTIISFSRVYLEMVQDFDDSVDLALCSYTSDSEVLNYCIEKKISLDCKYSGITESAVQKLHDHKLKAIVWTVDDFYKAYSMIHDMKVDAITTNKKIFD